MCGPGRVSDFAAGENKKEHKDRRQDGQEANASRTDETEREHGDGSGKSDSSENHLFPGGEECGNRREADEFHRMEGGERPRCLRLSDGSPSPEVITKLLANDCLASRFTRPAASEPGLGGCQGGRDSAMIGRAPRQRGHEPPDGFE